MQKRILSIIIFAAATLVASVSGQSSASGTWALTSNTTSSTSGNVAALGQSTSLLDYTEYPGTHQRRAITGKTLPALFSASHYVLYAISPAAGNNLTVNSIVMRLSTSGTSGSNGRVAIYYSTNSDFSDSTAIYTSASPFSLPSTHPTSNNINYTQTISVPDGSTLYVKVYPWLIGGGTSKYLGSSNVVISGTTEINSSSVITTSVSSLSAFSQTVGTPSSTQTYTVSGTTLTDDVTVTPPSGYEISTDAGSSWNDNSSPVTLTQSGGTLAGQPVTITVRLNNGTPTGSISGNITHTSTGAETKNVAVTGSVSSLDPDIAVTQSSLSFGTVTINTTSGEQTYSVSGTNLTPSSGNIAVTAPGGYEISTSSGSGFSSSLNLAYTSGTLSSTTVYVRFSPTSATSYNGNITNAGGGAATEDVAVSGTGSSFVFSNEFEAEDALLTSAYIRTQYTGYLGTGYTDLADKTGSAVEFVFSRSTAVTDTVTVRYANGGSNRTLAVTLNDGAVGSLNFTATGSWTTWSTVKIVVNLVSGINRLKFASTSNSSMPNLDKIIVAGQTATPMFKLTLTKSGSGTVDASPVESYYAWGTDVTLTATPTGGNNFIRWAGTNASTSNPYIVTMNSHKTEIGIIAPSSNTGTFPYESSPIGFASVNALGQNGTTGGSGAESQTVYVTSSADLYDIMLRRLDASMTLNFPPLIIYIVGTLDSSTNVTDMLDVKDVYNISIIGVGSDATLNRFGLNIWRSNNIIVRNLKIMNSPDDGIAVKGDDVETSGHHIWIDHCTFTNCYDGALDVTHTAAYVTLSWNYFYNHDKTCLMGHSDSQSSDVDLKVTYHHNYFNGTTQRHPRVRFGKAHVFNNYYAGVPGTIYGVSSNMEADVLVEGNYFSNITIPTETSRDGSPEGDLVERYNVFVSCGAPGTRGTTFEASAYYSYILDDANDVPQMLTDYAGSGKFEFLSGTQLPVELTGFSANVINNSVQLQWKTVTEVDNYGFEIQRSVISNQTSERAWSKISFVEGHGTSNVPKEYSFVDRPAIGARYVYRLKQIDRDGAFEYSQTVEAELTAVIPSVLTLRQNYPNPFNPATTIGFTVPHNGTTKLYVVNTLGQNVATLFAGETQTGREYKVQFNATHLSSGIYFSVLETGGQRLVKKMTLMK